MCPRVEAKAPIGQISRRLIDAKIPTDITLLIPELVSLQLRPLDETEKVTKIDAASEQIRSVGTETYWRNG